MSGISFQLDTQDKYLDMVITPQEAGTGLDLAGALAQVKASPYKHFYLFEENIKNAIEKLKQSIKAESNDPITERIAERRDAVIKYRLEDKDMTASLSITAPYGGKAPSVNALVKAAHDQGIIRGLSTKRLANMAKQVRKATPGEIIEDLVAKGLPEKNGRPSKLQPLVPNALERILKPQSAGGTRVDMRNLGDVICVKKGTELLRRLPPTQGRNGYTVTGAVLEAKPGSWTKFQPGENTVMSDHDENLIIADITGMPKFKNDKMWVDDTFICTGVNVGTGNIKYDGAVLVNGDVTEKMTIIAEGDVTINGFVESATIHAGGDIIITEGAMGKVNDASTDYSTKLVSQGSIHIQHGQGLDINCAGNVTVGRQLAYSRIVCGGSVLVGPVENPNGNLFACDIQSHDKVIAGTLGAVSGSSLHIDFSPGFNSLLERKDTLDELLQVLRDNNARHMDKMTLIRKKKIHADLKEKFSEAEELLRNELALLQWLEMKAIDMRDAKDEYQQAIQLIANKRLYPGVTVKLNNRTWRAEREYAKAKVFYEGHQWQYEPLL
ncbi:FapA family protein [Aestuariibacter halophilus]|uniref:FapA family protein n=1 Tax=Fluctibacter halophilus TaxID=226011 RepID=A0ABS8G4Q5_9ALTE|nr:FapA family protein [Aestuariibacter halophilus]MCC2615520.1 FapA family protein [Aestuariibacter halophilus]